MFPAIATIALSQTPFVPVEPTNPPQVPVEIVIVRGAALDRGRDQATQISFGAQALQAQSDARLDVIVRQVPGVSLFRRTPSTVANATIQGIGLRAIAPNGAGRALVTLDQVPQNDPFGGWVYWGRYDPALLTKVEVKRGAAGAGFGPLALTGTLAISERQDVKGLTNLTLSTPGNVKASFAQGGATPTSRFAVLVGYEASKGAFALARRQRGPIDEPVNYNFGHATFKTQIDQAQGQLNARISGFVEAKGAGIAGGQSRSSGLDVSLSRDWQTNNGQLSLLAYAQARDFANTAFAANGARTVSSPTLDQFATPSSAIGGAVQVIPHAALWQLSLEWRSAQGQTQELFRYLGNDFTRQRVAGGQQDFVGLGVTLLDRLDLGFFDLSFDGALRVDHWANRGAMRRETDRNNGQVTLQETPPDRSGEIISGRISLEHGGGVWRMSAYRTFRPPSLNELHRPFRLGNDVTEANAGLEPEILTGLDVDWNQEAHWAGLDWQMRGTLFFNQLQDPVANLTIGQGPGVFARIGFLPIGGTARVRVNIGKINAQGFEWQANWQAKNGNHSGYFGFSHTHARVDGADQLPQLSGKKPAQASPWAVSLGAQWRLWPNQYLNIDFSGEGPRFEDDLNTRTLAAFALMDVRYEWRFNSQSRLFVGLDNAFNTPVQSGRTADNLVSLAPGRALKLGIAINY